MKPSPLVLRLSLALAALGTPAYAAFNTTAGGTYDYLNAENWASGIDNTWTSTIAGNQILTFGTDHTLSSTLNIGNTGTFNHTFIGSGANRTLTLGGGISLGNSATNTNTVTIGSTTDGQRLNLDLGGANRTLSVGTNRTLEILNVVSGANSITKTGAGTLKLTNTANTFTGGISIGGGSPSTFGGVLEVTKLADSGTASSIGAGSSITFGGTGGAATLRYVGSGDASNRAFTIGSQGAIFESSGTGALQFTSTANIDVSPSNTVSRTITFTGTNTNDNSFAGVIRNPSVSAQTSITKEGTGTWVLTGNNTNTGNITVTEGILAIGAANRLADTATLVMNGGTFATRGFSETLGTVTLNADSIIDLGSGASALVFADSSDAIWGATFSLSFINFTDGMDSIRFGSDQDGLTLAQLGQITINGQLVTIDSSGFLTAVPEPSAFAALAGLATLGFVASRRRRQAAA